MGFADVTSARLIVEDGFDVECRITRDVESTGDDVFDPNTGDIVPPSPDSVLVYRGPSMIRSITGFGTQRLEGGAEVYLDDYRARLPAKVDNVQIGDIYTVTEALNDASMVDRTFTVRQVAGGSYAVSRILILQSRARGPRT